VQAYTPFRKKSRRLFVTSPPLFNSNTSERAPLCRETLFLPFKLPLLPPAASSDLSLLDLPRFFAPQLVPCPKTQGFFFALAKKNLLYIFLQDLFPLNAFSSCRSDFSVCLSDDHFFLGKLQVSIKIINIGFRLQLPPTRPLSIPNKYSPFQAASVSASYFSKPGPL